MATEFKIRTSDEIRESMLSEYVADMQSITDKPINVGPGTEPFVRFTSIASEFELLYNTAFLKLNSFMPDTAEGDDLDRLLAVSGLSRKAAGPSLGFITLNSNNPTVTIPSGSRLTCNGLQFEVIQSGVYANKSLVQIRSIDTGSSTNLPAGSIFNWINTPAGAGATAVSTAITGGSDVETDASARSRLSQLISNPPSLGNWQQLVSMIGTFDTVGSEVWIYAIADGPATQHIAISTPPSISYQGRDVLNIPNMDNIANQTFANVFPGAETIITSVINVPFDVAFKLSIPFPVGAPVNGIGGGWKNYSPFPNPDGYFFSSCAVTAVTSAVNFTIGLSNGNKRCIPGQTEISWIDKSNASAAGWIVKTGKVTAVTENLGLNTYTLTIDTPFTGIALGDYIFPASENGQNYLASVLSSFAALGPGQKTNVAAIIDKAARNPNTAVVPCIVDFQFTDALGNNPEVQFSNFLYRQYGSSEPPLATQNAPVGTYTLDFSSGTYYQTTYNSNDEPNRQTVSVSGIKTAPYIYTPNQIGWYPI
jgi:uncharacterized phage protein gp47/JayE